MPTCEMSARIASVRVTPRMGVGRHVPNVMFAAFMDPMRKSEASATASAMRRGSLRTCPSMSSPSSSIVPITPCQTG